MSRRSHPVECGPATETHPPTGRAVAFTGLGVLALLFWSTTWAFARDLSESIGTFTAGASIYLLAGAAGLLWLRSRPEALVQMVRLPKAYLLGCGGLFVVYITSIYAAVGGSANRQQAVEVTLINYLWPSLTILFSLVILGRRARWWLLVGLLLATGGVAAALVSGSDFSWRLLGQNLRQHRGPYLLALLAALAWSPFSSLTRRLAGRAPGLATPLFLLAAGAALLAIRLIVRESGQWSAGVVGKVVYMAALPALGGYLFWDLAMRRGRIILLASLSYFIPLLATVINCWYLGVPMGGRLWLACGLLIAGSFLCHRAVPEPDGRPDGLEREGPCHETSDARCGV